MSTTTTSKRTLDRRSIETMLRLLDAAVRRSIEDQQEVARAAAFLREGGSLGDLMPHGERGAAILDAVAANHDETADFLSRLYDLLDAAEAVEVTI